MLLEKSIPLATLAGVIQTIRIESCHEESKAQNLVSIYSDIEAALAGYKIPCFSEKWEADQDKELPKQEYCSEKLDSALSETIHTAEIIYIIACTNLMILNHTTEILSSFESKTAYIEACLTDAYQQTKNAVFEAYKDDNDVPYLNLVQAQKVLINLIDRIMDRVNLQTFKDLSTWELTPNKGDPTRISNIANTLLWWSLELNAEFRDANHYYI